MADQDICAELRLLAATWDGSARVKARKPEVQNIADALEAGINAMFSDTADAMRRAADEIDRLRGDGWVRCSERLPERGMGVLCAYRQAVFAGFNLGHDGGWWSLEDGSHVEVTHWRPLPPPPSEEGCSDG